MWELNHKEGWAPKNWCFWTVVLEKTLESPLDYKEIKPVNPKGTQAWIFIGRTDAEAPIFSHLIQRANLLERTLTGKDWRQKKKGTAEDEMLGWYHWFNGHEFEQAQEMVKDREAWRAAVYGITESDTTDWLKNNNPSVLWALISWPLKIVLSWIPWPLTSGWVEGMMAPADQKRR